MGRAAGKSVPMPSGGERGRRVKGGRGLSGHEALSRRDLSARIDADDVTSGMALSPDKPHNVEHTQKELG